MKHFLNLFHPEDIFLSGAYSSLETYIESQSTTSGNLGPTGASVFPLTKEAGGPRVRANNFVGNTSLFLPPLLSSSAVSVAVPHCAPHLPPTPHPPPPPRPLVPSHVPMPPR